MILTKSIKIKIVPYYDKTYYQLDYYKKRDIKDFKKEIEIEIDPNHLSVRHVVDIEVECDLCHKKETVKYRTYHENVKRNGKYMCIKCGNNRSDTKYKRGNTMINKYGVDNYVKTDEYITRKKKTCMEKYGVESFSQTDEFKEKNKKTCLARYGVEHHSMTEEFKTFQTEHNFYSTDEWKERKFKMINFKDL
jgi:hypothetical protein